MAPSNKNITSEPIKIGVWTSKTRIFNSKRLVIATGKSGWHKTPPDVTLFASIPCRLTATLSPALAMPHVWESRSNERTVPMSPEGRTRTYKSTYEITLVTTSTKDKTRIQQVKIQNATQFFMVLYFLLFPRVHFKYIYEMKCVQRPLNMQYLRLKFRVTFYLYGV